MILLRHAKSSWSDATLADADRPLAPRGRKAAKRIAEHLRKTRARPELVLCSTSLRTRQTLDAIRPAVGEVPVELEPGLYAASDDELLDRLRTLPESVGSVLLVAHNPGLQDLALSLAATGAELEQLRAKFPTGALATLAVRSESWTELGPGGAELVDYVVPRELE